MRFKNKLFSTKNKIFLSFILFSLIVVIIEKNLEGIFYEFVYPKYFEREEDYATGTPGNIYLILSILIIVIAAIILYKLTSGILQKESEKRIKEQNLMYAAIAHDLKTPMTSVQGFAKALSEGKVSDEEKKEIYDIIYAKSNTMNDMINTLFEYSKLGTQEYKPIPESFDICSLVRDIAAENYTEFEEHGIELDIDIPDEPIMCMLDKKLFGRVINNLLGNANKYNHTGKEVGIKLYKDSDNVVIEVTDDGEAIDEEFVPRMFEAFARGDKTRKTDGGTGLGLGISRKIVEKHKGTLKYIWAENRNCFCIRL